MSIQTEPLCDSVLSTEHKSLGEKRKADNEHDSSVNPPRKQIVTDVSSGSFDINVLQNPLNESKPIKDSNRYNNKPLKLIKVKDKMTLTLQMSKNLQTRKKY